ncbi:hypothetical protein PanWU01x14_313990 [Parasponia andersonii]|uniref:Uncharacterized protein n=1 Tax=Parasponia andersonii TaxID=3476 RepID=A0A2P5ANU8_PARAD|nr:hypothetical protein PanWU01x14_313990 [Parasponia andersonii]
MSLKHLVREFRTTHKLFLITVANDGRSIKVLERNGGRDYEVSFELGGAAWLLDAVEVAIRDEGKGQFFRKFRGSSYLLLLEVKYNNGGKFLQLVKLQNGVESKVIVPSEVRGRGWQDFQDCLGSLMGRKKGDQGQVHRTGNQWIGIEGIPADWWYIHVFKVIDEKLGGFINVAEDTLSFDFMNYAKIRVKGGRNGFPSATLDLHRGSDIVTLGVFPLEESNSRKLVGLCRSIGPTARHSECRERQMVQDRESCQLPTLQLVADEVLLGGTSADNSDRAIRDKKSTTEDEIDSTGAKESVSPHRF